MVHVLVLYNGKLSISVLPAVNRDTFSGPVMKGQSPSSTGSGG